MFTRNLPAALEHAGINQRELARRMNIARSTTSHWMTGRREPDLDTIARVAAELGVRAAWLAFDDGPMLEESTESSPARPPRRASGVTRAAVPSPAAKVA